VHSRSIGKLKHFWVKRFITHPKPVVTICTTKFNDIPFLVLPIQSIDMWISEQTAITSTYSIS